MEHMPAPVAVPSAEIAALEEHYVFRQRAAIIDFLERYPFVVTLLTEAHDKLETFFPDRQAFVRPDTNAGRLLVTVVTTFAPHEADARFTRFGEAWWLAALERAQNRLHIVLER